MSAFCDVKRKTQFRTDSMVRFALVTAVFGLVASGDLCGEDDVTPPDPVAVLRSVRAAQSSMHQTFKGKLRHGSRSIEYRMTLDGPMVRFEFPGAEGKEPQVVVIRFGAFDATLEVRDAAGKLLSVRFDEEVLGMGVSYEDLALRFIFWPSVTLEGEERLMLSKCWKLRVKRPQGSSSAYQEVVLWVGQSNGAFLKSEAYGEKGVLLRRLTVRSLQSLNQMTTLKQLRAESPNEGGEPTYLDVDGDPAARTGR